MADRRLSRSREGAALSHDSFKAVAIFHEILDGYGYASRILLHGCYLPVDPKCRESFASHVSVITISDESILF